MSDMLLSVENVSKKFCRSLKKSLWYGLKDMTSELLGCSSGHDELREGEFWANKDISFEVKRGETIGLIGHNGAGKTTLLRMLNGLIKPDTGRIEIRWRMQALIALGAGFNPILSGRENVYVNAAVLGIRKAEVDRKFDEIVEFSGIGEFIDTPVQSYSSGMAVRLGFAVAANMEPDILLVDEVLAVGDEGFQSKCLNKIGELKKNGTAIVLVSHNMHTMNVFSTRVIFLNKGCCMLFEDASEGVSFYKKSFQNFTDDIQKINSGNEFVKFSDVCVEKRRLQPGDDISISLNYASTKSYENVEVDLTIYSDNDMGQYFQATNQVYGQVLKIDEGKGSKNFVIYGVPINNSSAIMGLSIWSENRNELLFWWRIPILFLGIRGSNGKNFFKVTYSHCE